MPLRNPFKRSEPTESSQPPSRTWSFSTTSTSSAQPPEPLQPAEYQLSEINDSGVFLPPSPEHSKPTFWHSKSTTSIASHPRSPAIEPFNMSRESFDSYRRSFDICARAPVAAHEDPRRSLDSSLFLSPTRLSADQPAAEWPREEDELEDVGLADEAPAKQVVPRRRGLFARLTEPTERVPQEPREQELGIRPSSFQLFSGRKRGLSVQGDELRSLSSTATPTISVGGE